MTTQDDPLRQAASVEEIREGLGFAGQYLDAFALVSELMIDDAEAPTDRQAAGATASRLAMVAALSLESAAQDLRVLAGLATLAYLKVDEESDA